MCVVFILRITWVANFESTEKKNFTMSFNVQNASNNNLFVYNFLHIDINIQAIS